MKKTLTAILTAGAIALSGTAAFGIYGASNARTPEGHEGYVYHDPVFLGKKKFIEGQQGPTSTGLTWRQYATNIDMRPDTYSEQYEILSKDNLNVNFRSHAKISLKPGSVQQVVERFGAEAWYKNNVKEHYRAVVRAEVRRYNAYDIKTQSQEIARNALEALREQYKDSPVVFETVSIGNIDYPASVNKEIEQKLAANQRLERMDIEKDIATKEAEVRVEKANGLAKAQKIINDTLTPLYVQHEAIEAMGKLSDSDNTTFVFVPTNPEGAGVPLILNGKK